MTDALTITPEYLRNHHTDTGKVLDLKDCGIGLGKAFSSPKVYFMLSSFGVEGFQKHIRKSVELNKVFLDNIKNSKIFTIFTKPRFGLTVFQLNVKGSLEEVNKVNEKFYNELLKHSNELTLTHTIVNGHYCIRFVVGCPQTQVRHVIKAYEVIYDVGQSILSA